MKEASQPQIKFIRNLLAERKIEPEARREAERRIEQGLTTATAHIWIERLLELPKDENAQGRQKAVCEEVAAGRYAVNLTGKLRFYRIDRPEEGKWAGYVFVKEQAGPNYYSIRDRTQREMILNAIARDPKEALTRYGKELGHCGRCGLELTKDLSRERGIGPHCWEALGY